MEPEKRRVVFVVGTGPGGATTMTAVLRSLGLRVPQDDSESRTDGVLEPPWVTDLHRELFDRTGVQDGDARPSAWYDAGKLGQFELLRQRVTTWLEAQFVEAGPELVITDERLGWFAGLWRAAALRCGATPSFVVVVGPDQSSSGAAGAGPAGSTAGWVNRALHVERATRGSVRGLVRHADLVEDWTGPVFALGRALDLTAVAEATANAQRAVHTLLAQRRPGGSADATGGAAAREVPAPPRLQDLREQTARALDLLAGPDGDRPEVHDRLDALRGDYAELYAEAEALSASSARASYRCGRLVDLDPVHPHAAAVLPAARRPATSPGIPGASGASGVPGVTGVTGASDPASGGGSSRMPHRVRALVPPRARRGLRRALGRERGA